MKLYSIFYKGDMNNPKTFEGITDNFEKWLENHNKDRAEYDEDDAECGYKEDADDFEVEEVALYLYNKENDNE